MAKANLLTKLVGLVAGKPVDQDQLQQELTAPNITGLRPIISGHPEEGLDPGRLAQILREAEWGNLIPAMWLAEAMEEKNLHYRAVLSTRKLAVSSLPIQVAAASADAADIRAAELVRDVLTGPVLQGAAYDVLDAIGKGFSVSELIWDTSGGEWRPERIAWRDPSWFEFDRVDGRTILMRGGPGDGPQAFRADPGEMLRGNYGTPLPPFKFIVHTHRSKSGLPIRGGLMRPAAWAYMFSNFSLRAWAIFLEVYGHPLRLGKYDAGATAEDKKTLLRAVRSISADAAAIVPSSMGIEFVAAGAAGAGSASAHQANLDWWNDQLSKLVLGQTGTTDTAAYAGTANAHEHVRDDIRDSDAAQLAATLARDLVRPLVDLNVGPRLRYPTVTIGEPESEDMAALVENVRAYVSMGGIVPAAWLGAKLGVPAPEPGEAILTAPAPAMALGGGNNPGDEGEDDEDESGDDGEAEREGGRTAGLAVHAQMPEAAAPATDAIDALQSSVLDEGWERMVSPLTGPLTALLDDCRDLAEFQRRLPELIAGQDPAVLAEALARASFATRLAGLVGAPVGPGE